MLKPFSCGGLESLFFCGEELTVSARGSVIVGASAFAFFSLSPPTAEAALVDPASAAEAAATVAVAALANPAVAAALRDLAELRRICLSLELAVFSRLKASPWMIVGDFLRAPLGLREVAFIALGGGCGPVELTFGVLGRVCGLRERFFVWLRRGCGL